MNEVSESCIPETDPECKGLSLYHPSYNWTVQLKVMHSMTEPDQINTENVHFVGFKLSTGINTRGAEGALELANYIYVNYIFQ